MRLIEIPDRTAEQVDIGHPDIDMVKIMNCRVHVGITFCLRQMYRLRFAHAAELTISCFNFINGPGAFRITFAEPLRNAAIINAVRASLDNNCRVVKIRLCRRSAAFFVRKAAGLSLSFAVHSLIKLPGDLQRHFSLISLAGRLLDLPVHARAFEHRVGRRAGSSVVQVAGAQQKFHQIPDRNCDFRVHRNIVQRNRSARISN